MPRTELPSGEWVDWTDDWMSGVRFAVKAAVVFRTVVSTSGAREVVQETDGANDDRQLVALWGQVITAWSFADKGIPVPKDNVGGPEVIWATLKGRDFNALAEATQDLFDEVTATPTRRKSAGASSTA